MAHQKCSATVLVAHIGEPPDVAKANSEAKGGEEELAVVPPLASTQISLLAPTQIFNLLAILSISPQPKFTFPTLFHVVIFLTGVTSIC